MMSRLQALQPDALVETMASSGITRHLAFKNEECVVLRSTSKPGVVSGWHTHGDYDVYGYVTSGTVRLESNQGGLDFIVVNPGGFLHVPANTVHREINPSSNQVNEIILFLCGSGQMVYNVEGPG